MTTKQTFSADLLTDVGAAWRKRGAAAIEWICASISRRSLKDYQLNL
jgi:hypothetical protein